MAEIDLNKLKEEQIRLSSKVVLSDGFSEIKYIAGADQCYINEEMISVFVVLDYKSWEIVERKYTITKPIMNYVPGFLSYREMPGVALTYSHLEKKPDVVMMGANGILHPRRFGMASHFGVLQNIPTIGISKHLLCGKLIGDSVYLEKDVVGKKILTKKGAKPIFVSPGNLISMTSAVEIVKRFIKEPYKMPYPLAMAHKYSHQIKRKIKEGSLEK